MMDSFRAFPTLTTKRLFLRETLLSDARAVLEVLQDEEVCRFYNLTPLVDIEQARHIIASRRERFESGQGIRWAIATPEDNVVIGSCGYVHWAREWRKAELGYDLARSWWGQGLMTEALAEIIRYGFERMGLNRIEALVVPENVASLRVLEKLGFSREGLLREVGYWKGAHHDLALMALLEREWAAEPQG
jgi:[ribosomal protein S5]-alanine N-acetyltransferase